MNTIVLALDRYQISSNEQKAIETINNICLIYFISELCLKFLGSTIYFLILIINNLQIK